MTRWIPLGLAAAALIVPGCAQQPTTPLAQKDQPLVLDTVTGSRTARHVKVAGNNEALTASPVHILTREDIDRTGEVNLADVLKRQPYVH